MMTRGNILSFTNQNGKTAYNPTIPFEFNGKKYMGIRAESLESELDSQTLFAYEKDCEKDLWEIDYSLDSLPLQDPAYAKIKGEIFILGVKVNKEKDGMRWKQEIYRGDSIRNLEYFTSGPKGIKDIRLVDLKDRVGVFTRPNGKIAYLEVGNIEELGELSESDWYNCPKIIMGLFEENLWGGVNQAIKISPREIGIIGHIASQSINGGNKLQKYYYGMSFKFNPKKLIKRDFKIIAKRNDFPPSHAKRSPELDDVIFPAGIEEKTNNFYCGLSDFCIGKKEIKDVF